jgi:hypothetical protein
MFTFVKNKRIQNIFLIIFFVSFFGGGIIYGLIKRNKLEKGPSNYSIAIITKFQYGSRVAPWFNYEFEVNNKTINGTYDIADKMGKLSGSVLRSYVGKRFFVKFYVEDPDINELKIYNPVPDSIKEAPKDGWGPPLSEE